MASLTALRQSLRYLKLNETHFRQCSRLLHEDSKYDDFLFAKTAIDDEKRSNSGFVTSAKKQVAPNDESSSENSNQQQTTGSYFLTPLFCTYCCVQERRSFTWREYVMLTTSIIGLCTTCYYRFDSKKVFEDIESLLDKFSVQVK